jgi:PAS domain-containing protein
MACCYILFIYTRRSRHSIITGTPERTAGNNKKRDRGIGTIMTTDTAINQPGEGSPFGEVPDNFFKQYLPLNDSKRLLKALFEILPAGVAVLDGNQQIIDCNPALVKILGITEEGLRNHCCLIVNSIKKVVEKQRFESCQAV